MSPTHPFLFDSVTEARIHQLFTQQVVEGIGFRPHLETAERAQFAGQPSCPEGIDHRHNFDGLPAGLRSHQSHLVDRQGRQKTKTPTSQVLVGAISRFDHPRRLWASSIAACARVQFEHIWYQFQYSSSGRRRAMFGQPFGREQMGNLWHISGGKTEG